MPPTYTQKELDDAVSKAKSEVYCEFQYKDYGTPDIRICPKCGKPDLHWSVSSHLNCRSCREDLRLERAERRVRELETFLERLPMSTPDTMEIRGFDGFVSDELKRPAYERVILRIDGGGDVGTLVEIFADGHVVFGPNYSADKTARLFWECMATFSPLHLEYEALKKKAAMLKELVEKDHASQGEVIRVLGEIASGKL